MNKDNFLTLNAISLEVLAHYIFSIIAAEDHKFLSGKLCYMYNQYPDNIATNRYYSYNAMFINRKWHSFQFNKLKTLHYTINNLKRHE